LNEISPVQKLGKNNGAYRGEIIHIHDVLRDLEAAARQHNWSVDHFHQVREFKLPVFHRQPAPVKQTRAKIYISAGIHGDEPASPLAALKLLQENLWPDNVEIFLVPCLNPVGYTVNRRENAEGVDLNRDYRQSKSAEIRAHIEWLERQPNFDVYLCLHEDWESHGFYLYEQNPDQRRSFADSVIDSVRAVCPIDESPEIEDRPAGNGIIRPILNPQDRPEWPEALYLISHKSRQGYTFEAPSDFPLPVRIDALTTAVNTVVRSLTQQT
jgi:hypothetical protein